MKNFIFRTFRKAFLRLTRWTEIQETRLTHPVQAYGPEAYRKSPHYLPLPPKRPYTGPEVDADEPFDRVAALNEKLREYYALPREKRDLAVLARLQTALWDSDPRKPLRRGPQLSDYNGFDYMDHSLDPTPPVAGGLSAFRLAVSVQAAKDVAGRMNHFHLPDPSTNEQCRNLVRAVQLARSITVTT